MLCNSCLLCTTNFWCGTDYFLSVCNVLHGNVHIPFKVQYEIENILKEKKLCEFEHEILCFTYITLNLQ